MEKRSVGRPRMKEFRGSEWREMRKEVRERSRVRTEGEVRGQKGKGTREGERE